MLLSPFTSTVLLQVKLQELYTSVCQRNPQFIEKVPHLPELPGELTSLTFLLHISFTLSIVREVKYLCLVCQPDVQVAEVAVPSSTIDLMSFSL